MKKEAILNCVNTRGKYISHLCPAVICFDFVREVLSVAEDDALPAQIKITVSNRKIPRSKRIVLTLFPGNFWRWELDKDRYGSMFSGLKAFLEIDKMELRNKKRIQKVGYIRIDKIDE